MFALLPVTLTSLISIIAWFPLFVNNIKNYYDIESPRLNNMIKIPIIPSSGSFERVWAI